MRRSKLNVIGIPLLATLLSVPVWGANTAQRGMINYLEGQASIGTQPLDMKSAGSEMLGSGQSLVTGNGKAEVLLTPGVFVRIADNSSLTMISPDLANTEVRLDKGRAMVEARARVAEIHKENNLLVDEDDATTRLLKKGLYDFDANSGQVRVFEGQAMVQMDGWQVKVKGGHEVNLNRPANAQKFDKESYEDSFYRWARLRSDYPSEANADLAQSYSNGGGASVGAG